MAKDKTQTGKNFRAVPVADVPLLAALQPSPVCGSGRKDLTNGKLSDTEAKRYWAWIARGCPDGSSEYISEETIVINAEEE